MQCSGRWFLSVSSILSVESTLPEEYATGGVIRQAGACVCTVARTKHPG
jgi:hypothetical protein